MTDETGACIKPACSRWFSGDQESAEQLAETMRRHVVAWAYECRDGHWHVEAVA